MHSSIYKYAPEGMASGEMPPFTSDGVNHYRHYQDEAEPTSCLGKIKRV